MNIYKLVHDSPGRLRFRPVRTGASKMEVKKWIAAVIDCEGETEIIVSEKTGSILILYKDASVRNAFIVAFYELAHAEEQRAKKKKKSLPRQTLPKNIKLLSPEDPGVRNPIPGKIISYAFPRIIRYAVAAIRSIPYVLTGMGELFKGKLGLNVLDGAALLVCLLRRDFATASSITFFFALGEYLADWTRKKSRASLAESLALNIETVWVRVGDLERQAHISDLEAGDLVIIRSGAIFPIDGTVVEGDGMVNQASMTGETMPSHKKPGATVYAGTVLEEGTLVVKATKVGSDTRIRSIIKTIEDSEAVKASIQGRYERMADAIVPFNFLLSGLVFALTRNAMRASSVLLVDYSCAIRLATPLCIFTAMRQASDKGILIKGGKYMEAVEEATAVVFDKTGTLTEAKPVLVGVVPFGGRSSDDILRLSACLEEHFVHPVGQAVVRAAEERGLKHREEHAEVKYIVAHGIASVWNEKEVAIGSGHFIHEDLHIPFTEEQQANIDMYAAEGKSILYLGIDSELAGILLIEDKIRDETPEVIRKLREDGVQKILMLTGDGELTAKNIAERAGITEYRSNLLPEQKSVVVEELQREGYKVIMVGDGINDSPALSAADVGVAMAEGADLAREVADVVLLNGKLEGLLYARQISRLALKRVKNQFVTSVGLNTAFLVGGLMAVITPAMSALLHNATTAGIALTSIRALPAGDDKGKSSGRLPVFASMGKNRSKILPAQSAATLPGEDSTSTEATLAANP